MHSPVATSHTRTVLSLLADISYVPSDENPAEYTNPLLWSCKVCSHLPVETFHSRTVWSELADTSVVPSGENPAEVTTALFPTSTPQNRPARHHFAYSANHVGRQATPCLQCVSN